MIAKKILEEAMQLKATADIGLLYCQSPYDRERYEAIRQTSLRLMEMIGPDDLAAIEHSFLPPADYPTAKVDLRALILSDDNEVLLVKESADGRWALPGGWADVGASAAENIVKECREEAGLEVTASRLLAVFDKAKHAHPPQAAYVYKMVFLCRPAGGQLQKGFDVLDIGYFPLQQLPPLSKDRILASQIETVCRLAEQPGASTYFD